MTKNRLEFLSDGVFAIVMTILVVEITVPQVDQILSSLPEILSYFLSFAILANLWTTHNFLFSVFSQNTTRGLAALNIILLSFMSLIPFSTSFLGKYPDQSVAISFYSIHILIISLLIFIIREYVNASASINNPDPKMINFTDKDKFYGTSRIAINVGTSIFAVVVSNYSTSVAIGFLLFPVIVGAVPGLLGWLLRITQIERLANIK